MEKLINKEQWFPHSIEKVWKAITEAEQVSQWLVPTNFKGERGAEFQLRDPKSDCNVITGVVEKAEPYELTYTWIDENWKSVITKVSWSLIPENNGTLVRMSHSGISNYEEEVAQKQFANFSGGWTNCFDRLAEVLNKS